MDVEWKVGEMNLWCEEKENGFRPVFDGPVAIVHIPSKIRRRV